MTPESGTTKQEEKITLMGTIAHKMHFKVAVITFKGAFRFAIKLALEENKYEKWNDLVAQSPKIRKIFFESILSNSINQLNKIGLSEPQIKVLFERLKKENQSYL